MQQKNQVVKTSNDKPNISDSGIQYFSIYGKMQESGLIAVIPLMHTLAILGQYPVLSHPESSHGAPLGVGVVAADLTLGTT